MYVKLQAKLTAKESKYLSNSSKYKLLHLSLKKAYNHDSVTPTWVTRLVKHLF